MPGKNMYGTHPFVMGKTTDNTWFVVYNNIAAAQDWWVKNAASGGDVSLTLMAVGGVGDLFFMNAATPDAVTMKYHQVVGKPVLTPQWALGWHQCRWGYTKTEDLREVVANYA